ITPVGVSIGAVDGVLMNGNGYTPVTETTSLMTAGRAIPLLSPTAMLSALLLAEKMLPPVPVPVPPAAPPPPPAPPPAPPPPPASPRRPRQPGRQLCVSRQVPPAACRTRR